MSRQKIESANNRRLLNRNELNFNSSSSTNSSNFSSNKAAMLLKDNEITSSSSSTVDLPDETVSLSSGGGGGGSINFDRYNKIIIKRKNNQKHNHNHHYVDKSTDSSEKSINTLTVSDLDTHNSNSNQSEMKLLRKKFIKFILREDTYSLKNVCEHNKIDLLSIKDKHLNTLMHIACGFGRLKSVQALMKLSPAMIDQLDNKNHSPLDVAIKHGQLDVTKWLLTKTERLIIDSRLNATTELNRTYDNNSTRSCLHLAAKHGENEILRFILNEMHKKQFSMDIQDLNGNTACHLAAKYGHLDCLQTLVEFNCDITIMNKSGHTPCFIAEYYGQNEIVHYLMIVETCINLSIKVVRMGRKLRETRNNNEILKAQMDEAIAINNDFINQRENVMNISLDLMQRQINELEAKINYEIEKFNMENRNLKEKLDILNSQLKSFTNSNDKLIEANNICNAINNKNVVIQPNLESVRQDMASTRQICSKVIQMDQKKLDSIKTRFEEIKSNLDNSSSSSSHDMKLKCSNGVIRSCDNSELIENREHFEILRKMYQETTHKLMIFRNALKENVNKSTDNHQHHHHKQQHQRPKSAIGPRKEYNNNKTYSSSSSTSINSNNLSDNMQIKSSTPTLMHHQNSNSTNYFLNTSPTINSDNQQKIEIENYIEYSSNDETLSENEYENRLNNVLINNNNKNNNGEEIGEDEYDVDELVLAQLNNNQKKNYFKPEPYLSTTDNEDEHNSSAPSIQTVIENHKLNANNYINGFNQQISPSHQHQHQRQYIIEEIEEKIEEQFEEEHEEMHQQHHHNKYK